jgi:uncharacterized protein YbjT (DUF2867 family)
MPRHVLVTGGTGTLGRLVVSRLQADGCTVRVLSRGTGPVDGAEVATGDLRTGNGVSTAVSDVDTIVHCASAPTGDEAATRNLVAAALAAGHPHLVFISIVGIDTVHMGYYRAKQAAERVVRESGLPWTILRATQFYDLILRGARPLSRLPVIPVPAGFRTQPVEADDVAARLVELATAEPAGAVRDMAGPRVFTFAELIRSYLTYRHTRRPVVELWLPGLGAVRAGGLLPAGEHDTGTGTWEAFLSRQSAS